MRGGGIFGGAEAAAASRSRPQQRRGGWWTQQRQQVVKRRERWLVALGIALHAVYMLSIFDIYFKTPIVHGMDPVPQRISPPAKRLVLFVADGLRADKFFEQESEGKFRAPFLRSVIKDWGRWGVSHARPPTESRPGHVSIIAGFYEDPSAVTKGWKANPVEFDSVFNQSRHTIAFGSPDIVPIFCSNLPHSTWSSYHPDFQDFATDASFLDHWSFDQFRSLVNRSYDDPKLRKLLLQDKLVIFLHLLGCDTNGHAHRPYSSIYLNNVKVVDQIAEGVYNLMESYFKDNQTAYIFTADHGMSDKGSHGDGHPSNTDTPLVAWGAGIKYPRRLIPSSQSDDGFRFVDDHKHDMPTPIEWGLTGIERIDVNQADIAPLMATLVGLPCPVNSVGNLPLSYLRLSEAEEVEAALANAKQILNQFLCKSQLKQSNSLWFKQFKPLANYSYVLSQIEDLIAARDYKAAMKLSQILRSLSLSGLHYFQTLTRLFREMICGRRIKLSLLESPNNKTASGALIILIGMASRWFDLSSDRDKFWSYIGQFKEQKSCLFLVQALLVALSSAMVWLSTSHRAQKKGLLLVHQLINWSITGISIVLPLFSPTSLLSRLTSIFLGFAPPFLLLSIGYEAIFYSALALVLMGWTLVERANLYMTKDKGSSLHIGNLENSITGSHGERCLQLSDLRIPLIFLVLFNVAFFGTGNFASIASFEISSVYRFITIFSPFLMAALLIFKLFIPFMLVICVFSAITKLIRVSRLGCYFLVILFSDVMTIHFFFLVRNTGSWMEIGNSISHFGIMSAQVVFILILFALTNIYTKDIEIPSLRLSSRKAM
ncbi:uncharacterized protein [Elaeis guineensis]|uniref:uncharacterized protein isoform X4 n=1 Tax=Elaeis guineensis var. tenera TaxID=51953 RepID=UPI003C6D9941